MAKQIGIGIIGCGNISQAYFNGAKLFEVLKVVSCADLKTELAEAKAAIDEARVVSLLSTNRHPLEVRLHRGGLARDAGGVGDDTSSL